MKCQASLSFLLLVLCFAVASARKAPAKTPGAFRRVKFTFYVSVKQGQLNFGTGDTGTQIGDRYVIVASIRATADPNSKQLGTADITCLLNAKSTKNSQNPGLNGRACSGTFFLSDGIIIGQGVVAPDATKDVFPISGGSGKYLGAGGIATIVPQNPPPAGLVTQSRYDFELIVPVV